jgi:RimJ/RimL family protein N-acetyltransferase
MTGPVTLDDLPYRRRGRSRMVVMDRSSPAALFDAPLSDGVVLLRRPHDGDVDTIYRYGQDPALAEDLWLPLPVPCPREVAAQRTREFAQGWTEGGRFGLTFAITAPPPDDLRGVVHLILDGAAGEIAYGVAPDARSRGLATRAVRLVTAWAFARLGVERLEICVTARGANGRASRRVAEKAGFVYVGLRHSRVAATSAEYDDPLYALAVPTPPAPCSS